ncbi:uncharacterized protein LOC115890597 [Sitophilus oryzae]|uniref:Uncharacterized protein LOC115890597 n=1 Tax=Sitophilus oryzae TaxID=7048 RepID=A0A6J2YU80_SITOR|nr:uncharacterized protein LOC115890597 [Sitophilus oryzae]
MGGLPTDEGGNYIPPKHTPIDKLHRWGLFINVMAHAVTTTVFNWREGLGIRSNTQAEGRQFLTQPATEKKSPEFLHHHHHHQQPQQSQHQQQKPISWKARRPPPSLVRRHPEAACTVTLRIDMKGIPYRGKV